MRKIKQISLFQIFALLIFAVMSLGMQFAVPTLINPASDSLKFDREMKPVFVATFKRQEQRKPLWAEGIEKAYQNYRAFEISA